MQQIENDNCNNGEKSDNRRYHEECILIPKEIHSNLLIIPHYQTVDQA